MSDVRQGPVYKFELLVCTQETFNAAGVRVNEVLPTMVTIYKFNGEPASNIPVLDKDGMGRVLAEIIRAEINR